MCNHCPLWRLQGVKVSPAGPSVAEAVSRALTAKESAGRRPVYTNSLRQYLARFSNQFGDLPIASVSASDVAEYLAPFRGHSRATHLNRISTLFAYAVRQGWRADNPCDRIERLTIDRQTPRILTPDEVDLILKITPTVLLPYLILCLFAGVRPTETMRLTWADVNLPSRSVTINAAASKVRQRRVVSLPDRAVRLLENHPIRSGPISPSHSTVRRWLRKARLQIGGKWPADILRHTAASYALALTGDASKVATQLGNSPKILLTHYNGLATKQDAERFYEQVQIL